MFKVNCVWLRRASPYQQKRERKILVERDFVEPFEEIFHPKDECECDQPGSVERRPTKNQRAKQNW